MSCNFKTEKEVKAILLEVAKKHENAPEVITQKRIQGKGTIQRNVTFVIRASSENEDLVNAVSALTLTYNQDMWLEGSEMNLQSGQNDVDYIYVTAIIKPVLGA